MGILSSSWEKLKQKEQERKERVRQQREAFKEELARQREEAPRKRGIAQAKARAEAELRPKQITGIRMGARRQEPSATQYSSNPFAPKLFTKDLSAFEFEEIRSPTPAKISYNMCDTSGLGGNNNNNLLDFSGRGSGFDLGFGNNQKRSRKKKRKS